MPSTFLPNKLPVCIKWFTYSMQVVILYRVSVIINPKSWNTLCNNSKWTWQKAVGTKYIQETGNGGGGGREVNLGSLSRHGYIRKLMSVLRLSRTGDWLSRIMEIRLRKIDVHHYYHEYRYFCFIKRPKVQPH